MLGHVVLRSVVGDIIQAGVPRPVTMFLVLGAIVFTMTYLLLPLSMKLVRTQRDFAVAGRY